MAEQVRYWRLSTYVNKLMSKHLAKGMVARPPRFPLKCLIMQIDLRSSIEPEDRSSLRNACRPKHLLNGVISTELAQTQLRC